MDREQLPDDGNRYEVLDGELFVTPQASADHQYVAFARKRVNIEFLLAEVRGEALVEPNGGGADLAPPPYRTTSRATTTRYRR